MFVPEDVPLCVPERLRPVMLPAETTDVGVIAPRPRDMDGIVVEVPTEAVMPLAGVTVTLVTVPTL